jgi:hypothetical protein
LNVNQLSLEQRELVLSLAKRLGSIHGISVVVLGGSQEFGPRVQKTLARLGASPAELVAAVESIAQLVRETVELTDGLYRPRLHLPKI